MRGLFGEPKNVPPAETFSFPECDRDMQPFVERHRFIRFFSSTVIPAAAAAARTFTLLTSLIAARLQKAEQNGARNRIDVRQFARISAIGDVNAIHVCRRKLA